MKRIEKLARECCRKDFEKDIITREDWAFFSGYVAGFTKSREMAADKVADMTDRTIRTEIRARFMAIGEEEV